MKSKLFILLLSAASVVTLNSCVKSANENPDTPPAEETATGIKGMTVPAGTKWKLSQEVTCNIASQKETKVYVSLSDKTAAFASFFVGGSNDPFKLSIPASVGSLYVAYEKADGVSAAAEVAVSGGAFSYTVPADARDFAAVLKAAATKAGDSDKGTVHYPATGGWGTLMFEDMWPAYGDYDFNDFVANYQVDFWPDGKQNNKYDMMVGRVRVKAVGGTLPYQFYLSVLGLKVNNVTDGRAEVRLKTNTVSTFAIELANASGAGSNTDAVFLFKDLQKNAAAADGANTRRGAELKASDLVTVEFVITFNQAITIHPDAVDFFIAREDQKKEIHVAGMWPGLYGQDQYNSLRTQTTSQANQQAQFFYSNNNLVWGINIPDEIPHAYEATDFLSAYPNLKNWAESGNTLYTDWYTDAPGNRNNANLVKEK